MKKIYLKEWVKPMAHEHAKSYVEDILGLKESNPKYKKEYDKEFYNFCKEFYEHSLVPHAEEGIEKKNNPKSKEYDPDNIETILRKKYFDYLAKTVKGYPMLDIFNLQSEDAIELKLIEIDKNFRGQGIGSKIMEDLISWADKNNKIIVLSPSEIKTSKLIRWYKSFDFLENKNRNKDFRFMNRMIRYPFGLTRSKWIDYKNKKNNPFIQDQLLNDLKTIANEIIDDSDYSDKVKKSVKWILKNDKEQVLEIIDDLTNNENEIPDIYKVIDLLLHIEDERIESEIASEEQNEYIKQKRLNDRKFSSVDKIYNDDQIEFLDTLDYLTQENIIDLISSPITGESSLDPEEMLREDDYKFFRKLGFNKR